MADEDGYLMLVHSVIKAEEWSRYWSLILIKISVRGFDKIYKEFFLERALNPLVCCAFANIQGGSN